MLAAIVVAAVYEPARWNGFVWDDWLPLTQTSALRDPARWWEGLLTPPLGDPSATRPLAMLSFMLQLWAGQTGPAPFHVVNVLVHASSVLLLAVLVRRIFGEVAGPQEARLAAAVSALVYGLHPALTESVLWISCRYDLLMTFFLLLALVLDRVIVPAAGWTRALLVATAFICGVLSKETAVGFLLALPLFHIAVDFSNGGRIDRAGLSAAVARHYKVYVVLFFFSVLYLGSRYALFGVSIGMGRMAAQFGELPSCGQRTVAVLASLAQLIADAFWPFRNLIPSRSLEVPIDVLAVAPLIAATGTLFLAILLTVRCVPAAGRAVVLLFLAFVAALIPVSNILPLPGRLGQIWVSDRYLTFPLVLLCLAIPFAYRVADSLFEKRLPSRRLLLAGIAMAWLAASIANVRSIVPLWQSERTLGIWAIQQGAKDAWRYRNLGEYYLTARQFGEARAVFLEAVRLKGNVGTNWYHLGLAEALLNDRAAAIQAFRRALEIDPDIIAARINLAKLALEDGDARAAAEVLEPGLRRLDTADDPGQAGTAHFTLGRAYAALGRRQEAVFQMERALKHAQNAEEREAATAALKSFLPLPEKRP